MLTVSSSSLGLCVHHVFEQLWSVCSPCLRAAVLCVFIVSSSSRGLCVHRVFEQRWSMCLPCLRAAVVCVFTVSSSSRSLCVHHVFEQPWSVCSPSLTRCRQIRYLYISSCIELYNQFELTINLIITHVLNRQVVYATPNIFLMTLETLFIGHETNHARRMNE